MTLETSELDIETQIGSGPAASTDDHAVVRLNVPKSIALLHEQIGDAGIEQILRRQLRLMRLRAGLREGSLGAWSEDQRQAIGEAVTTKLAEMSGEGGPDWFDARNVDEVLDAIEQALRVQFAEHPEDNLPETVIACLEDDAAGLRDENPEDERAENMARAAQLLRASLGTLTVLKISRAALVELRDGCAKVKEKLNAGIPDGDPVHPCAADLTWPMSTASLAAGKIDELLAGKEDAIHWPTGRQVGRRDDMSADGMLRVGLDSDNDVFVAVFDGKASASVEFCNAGGGGGRSPRTRAALINLMAAIEAENAESPIKAWPGSRG